MSSPYDQAADFMRSGWGKALRPILLGGAVLIAIPLFLSFCFTTVEPGELGVRQDMVFGGGITEEDFDSGYHLRILGVHRYYRLEEHFDFIELADDDPMRIRTRDNNIVTLDVSIPYRIKPGHAHRIVHAGLHVGDAYRERTHNTTVGVLRERLAVMSAPEFFDTNTRLRVTQETLASLNEALAEFHVEAERIFIRAVYYREDYENQQQRIQLLEQQGLLDQAQEEVALRQQSLDNYRQQTAALENSLNASWDRRLAVLARVYNVGFSDTDVDALAVAELAARGLYDDPTTPEDETAADIEAVRNEIRARYSGDAHASGVEGINADTNRQVAEIEGRANALQARYGAEADRVIAEIEFDRDRRINELLSSSGGRALVALEAAERVSFAPELVFHADSVPFLFDLNRLAGMLMGVTANGRGNSLLQ